MPDAQSGLRVLVVEDNPDSAESMAKLLRLFGHRSEVASDGRAALKAAIHQQPDVVLLDIGLPLMNGWEVARRIKECSGQTPPMLIAMTGYGRPEDHRRSAEVGIDLHLTKPVDPEQLRALLETVETHRPSPLLSASA